MLWASALISLSPTTTFTSRTVHTVDCKVDFFSFWLCFSDIVSYKEILSLRYFSEGNCFLMLPHLRRNWKLSRTKQTSSTCNTGLYRPKIAIFRTATWEANHSLSPNACHRSKLGARCRIGVHYMDICPFSYFNYAFIICCYSGDELTDSSTHQLFQHFNSFNVRISNSTEYICKCYPFLCSRWNNHQLRTVVNRNV